MTDHPRTRDDSPQSERLHGATPVDGGEHDGGTPKWLMALLALLIIAALVVGAFFLFGGDADVDVDPGDVDVEAPDVGVDVDAPDVDVEAPDVDVDPGDIEIDDATADASLDPDE